MIHKLAENLKKNELMSHSLSQTKMPNIKWVIRGKIDNLLRHLVLKEIVIHDIDQKLIEEVVILENDSTTINYCLLQSDPPPLFN